MRNELIRQIKAHIELEKLAGMKEIFVRGTRNKGQGSRVKGRGTKEEELDKVWQVVRHCHKCPLYKTKTHYVFGDGNPNAKLSFIGEAPGHEEDMQGLPFVGAAGKLLTKIIEAMGLKRDGVYIANMIKCRPPQNRVPFPEEIEKCRGYIEEQIEIIKPKVICALGRVAAQALLNTNEPINKMRGKFIEYRGIMVMVTYHPAYLLRNPRDKKLVWQDMKKIMEALKP